MKLIDLKRGEKFTLKGRPKTPENTYLFHHLDGMYSFCTKEGDKHPTHFSWNTPVEKVED